MSHDRTRSIQAQQRFRSHCRAHAVVDWGSSVHAVVLLSTYSFATLTDCPAVVSICINILSLSPPVPKLHLPIYILEPILDPSQSRCACLSQSRCAFGQGLIDHAGIRAFLTRVRLKHFPTLPPHNHQRLHPAISGRLSHCESCNDAHLCQFS